MRNKKAQEEALGFVAIIVIVVVLMVIFLGIALRKGPDASLKQNKDLQRFLDSTMSYTTSCAMDYEPNYLPVSEMLRHCYQGVTRCTSLESPCSVLRSTLSEILNASWKIGPDRKYSGYSLSVSLSSPDNSTRELFSISSGNCSFRYISAESITSAQNKGVIISSFKLCQPKEEIGV